MTEPELPELPKKPFWVPWFMDIPEWELENQVQEYQTLPWHTSYRKLSMVFLLAVAVLNLWVGVMLFRGGWSPPFTAAVSYALLAILVGKGVRIAMNVAMIVFTLDRIMGVAANPYNPLVWGIGLAWWLFFMERFWKAARVEQARAALAGSGSAERLDVEPPDQ